MEYELKGINQIAVRSDIGLTFAMGLRHILRQDPNVIMVGEIRDLETAEIAIRAALTGHLVFSTLHTNDAPSAFTRLIDMGIEPFLVASSVEAVMAQRLVRTICPHCKAEQKVERDYLRSIGFPSSEIDTAKFWRGAGCEECRQFGYQGRKGIYELLILNEAIRPLILNRAACLHHRPKSDGTGHAHLAHRRLEQSQGGQNHHRGSPPRHPNRTKNISTRSPTIKNRRFWPNNEHPTDLRRAHIKQHDLLRRSYSHPALALAIAHIFLLIALFFLIWK